MKQWVPTRPSGHHASLALNDAVRMLPTPTRLDYKGANGRPQEQNPTSHGSTAERNYSWDWPWVEIAALLCRVDDGLSRGVERSKRLKALGKAIVPRKVQFEFINLIEEKQRPIFYWLVLHSGRRPGEAMALHKSDYNKFKNAFVISRTISDRKVVDFPNNFKCHEAVCHESFEPFLEDLLATEDPFLFVNKSSKLDEGRYSDTVLNKAWAVNRRYYGIGG
ncbi:MAG: hypothetical protein KKF30_01165 [Proteobacteria bacterium]|nr:hypothetical protein [Pseudomonadota bacterium]MBU4470764.1 hypothetical protein [Pseudomonadota bacterium]MCG2751508.1 hypothetical protein [Desulfobacteraceae bacterium]